MTQTSIPFRHARAAGEHARQFLPAADVHGPDDVCWHFTVSYTPDQLAGLGTIPWSDGVLRACAGTHLLVAGYPLSIDDMFLIHPRLFFGNPTPWYRSQPFATADRVAARWYLIRKDPVPGSLCNTFDGRLLGEGEEVPRAVEVTYAVILHALATGVRLPENDFVRCIDTLPGGHRVIVGLFDCLRLDVCVGLDTDMGGCLGLASSRKLP